MFTISIRDFALRQWWGELTDEIDDAMPNLGPVLGEMFVNSVRDTIEQEGRPDAWLPRLANYPWPPLRKTNYMYDTIHYTLTEDSIDISSDAYYAEYQDKGTSHIPARPFFLLQTEDEQQMEDLLFRYFTE